MTHPQLTMFDVPAKKPEKPKSTGKSVAQKVNAKAVRQTIDQRFEEFAKNNPHVLTAALELARNWLARGDKYISAKALYENLRTTVSTTIGVGTVSYRLNNDFTAPMSRWLQAKEPRLVGVLRMRERKS